MSTAVDVWGLACAMWEAVTRRDLPGDHPVLGERAIQAKNWQKQIQTSLMPDFVEGLDDMIRAEIETELGRVGINELQYQLGAASTPQVDDSDRKNPFFLLQAEALDSEKEEIRSTVTSYLTVGGVSCLFSTTHFVCTKHVNT